MFKASALSILLFVFFFLSVFSCGSDTTIDHKKSVRMAWQNHFNAYLDFRGKESQMGTDSTKIVFENNSDYTVDSAIVIFENQGLLVHSYDTVKINFILSKSKKAVVAPSHKLGFKHKVEIFGIYSKALEFGYHADLPPTKQQGDCFHCK